MIARWPACPPYGGRYGNRPIPHLTVADATDPAQLGHVVTDIESSLPVHSRVAELSLVVRRAEDWELDATFPFRAQPNGA